MKRVTKTVTADFVPADRQGDFRFGNVKSRFGATSRYFTCDGQPFVPVAGEFHFSRYDRADWERELCKMKAQGLNAVSAYVFWNHHEKRCGQFDFSGNNDVAHFLALCKKTGLRVVLRIGPWCHGEVKRGGFPDYLAWVPGRRKNTPLYLFFVKRFWRALYREVAPMCDGETVFAVQIENEYGGPMSHIYKLREIAEEVGFTVPYFTMTAWPADNPDKRFVPMFGGYPEAPWTQNKRPLPPAARFAFCSGRSEVAIGEDLLGKKKKGADFSAFPYATCETGTGNQVSHHRRPVISSDDGYGVAFAKFASGANWLGYYMYHGGRNPAYKPMQESRRTFYPNDYPVVDYDFQAPVSKDGDVREHAHRLRLLHYFIGQNERRLARMQTFFDRLDETPYFSFRTDGESGLAFFSNYERGARTESASVDVTVRCGDKTVVVNGVQVPAGAMFFFPVGWIYGGVRFDYVMAQPIAQLEEGGTSHVYFMKIGETVEVCRDGVTETVSAAEYDVERDGRTLLHFLTREEALRFYVADGKAVFSEFPLFARDGETFCESKKEISRESVLLKEISPRRLKYSSYLFSNGKRKYYSLDVKDGWADGADDLEVTLDFKGLNLQMFRADGAIADDCFNTDGTFVFRLRRLLPDGKGGEFAIRICAATAKGRGRVYNEIGIRPSEVGLSVRKVCAVNVEKRR